jgi:phospholipase C
LKAAGAVGAAGIAAPVLSGTRALAIAGTRSARAAARATPLQHVIIDCQENRSFDHYYGFAPFAGLAAVPPGYSQPDGAGGSVAPSEFTSLSTPDIGHSWTAVHSEWDAAKMDGFLGPTGSTSRPERPGASSPTACCGARKYDSGWPAFFRGGVGGKAVM